MRSSLDVQAEMSSPLGRGNAFVTATCSVPTHEPLLLLRHAAKDSLPIDRMKIRRNARMPFLDIFYGCPLAAALSKTSPAPPTGHRRFVHASWNTQTEWIKVAASFCRLDFGHMQLDLITATICLTPVIACKGYTVYNRGVRQVLQDCL